MKPVNVKRARRNAKRMCATANCAGTQRKWTGTPQLDVLPQHFEMVQAKTDGGPTQMVGTRCSSIRYQRKRVRQHCEGHGDGVKNFYFFSLDFDSCATRCRTSCTFG